MGVREKVLRVLERIHLTLARPLGRARRTAEMCRRPGVERMALVEPPSRGRLLVIAPHPDDEAIGCGGTILRAAAAGAEVTCVLLTGGELGRPGAEPDATARRRRDEMLAGARMLGITRLEWLPGRDQELARQPELAGLLRALLTELKPDAVFLPFYLDAHLDHRMANEFFIEAAAGTLAPECPVWAYEVWSPCAANVAVDISGQAEAKAAAIAAHASQDDVMHYSRAMLGLNAYRALQVNWQGDAALTHAEAFLGLSLEDYRALAGPWLEKGRPS